MGIVTRFHWNLCWRRSFASRLCRRSVETGAMWRWLLFGIVRLIVRDRHYAKPKVLFWSNRTERKRKSKFSSAWKTEAEDFPSCPFLQNDWCVSSLLQWFLQLVLTLFLSVGISLDTVRAFQKNFEITNDWCRSVKPIYTVFSNWDMLCASFPRVSR